MVSVYNYPSAHRSFLRLKGSTLIITVFLFLALSYNLHVLWLFYDLGSLLLITHFITENRIYISRGKLFWLVLVLGYFLMIILIKGSGLYGVVSIWDTFKHIPYFIYFANLIRRIDIHTQNKFFRRLYKSILGVFLIQAIAVCIQYYTGTFFDNIAGTFGDGGSHAIGYISILAITSSIAYSKRTWVPFLITCISLVLNLLAENAGFFVLFILLGFGFVLIKGLRVKTIFMTILITILLFFILKINLYTEKSFFDVIFGRLVDVITFSETGDMLDPKGRSGFLYIAMLIGGWTGVGPGVYSSIYMFDGAGVTSLNGLQINITEASHLVAEVGFSGLILVVITYGLYVISLVKENITKLYLLFFFITSIFYSAVLMNESHAFMLLMTFMFLQKYESSNTSCSAKLSSKGAFRK